MKIGLNLLLWDGTITEKHVAVLEELAALGYDGVEFPIFSFDRNVAKKLRTHLDRLKLKCTITSCVPQDGSANPISEDKKIRQAALNHMKKTIGIAEILGAEVIAGPFTSPVGRLVGRPRTDEEWKWGVEVMQKVAKATENSGVLLALEALNRFETYFINTAADACKFAEEVNHPNFGIMWDTFHANIEEKNIQKAMMAVAHKIVHVHISENHRGIPGAGHIRFGDVFNCLKKMKYDRWLTIEAFGSALPELAAATCIWRELFPSSHDLAEKGLQFIKKQWEKG
ncbi:MAG: sugar phosphate isomerase/epimerase [Candidatus Omnitrophota bacterium]|jgi:D-psicose/D-tagatose/L-ribulose 3-epimerase|nr:MAG: sugar phosphate isomerase/epimerase [Candidatus Omnitrophota bacterium]